MSWPDPRAGLVLNYAYLWQREEMQSREEGLKNRPCMVMGVEGAGHDRLVTVCPITHRPPSGGDSVEIPAEAKRKLGLDDSRSWIITSEKNRFRWKDSPDLLPVHGRGPTSYEYGMLPPAITSAALTKVEDALVNQRLHIVERTHNTLSDDQHRLGRASGVGSADRIRAMTAPLTPEEERTRSAQTRTQETEQYIHPDRTNGRRL